MPKDRDDRKNTLNSLEVNTFSVDYSKSNRTKCIVCTHPFLKGWDGKSEKWSFAGGYKISNIKGWDEKRGRVPQEGGISFLDSHEQNIFVKFLIKL